LEIFVYGLGYVGTVNALFFASKGLKVQGIEIVPEKVSQLKKGRLHLFEPHLKEALAEVTENGLLTFSTEAESQNIENAVFLVCAGTPRGVDGEVELGQIFSVVEDIKKVLSEGLVKKSLIVIRSTIPPGSTDKIIAQFKDIEGDVSFLYYPEFLREGNAWGDFQNPSEVILATNNSVFSLEKDFSNFFNAIPKMSEAKWVSIEVAEMLKYCLNSFNALRVSYINEIASLSGKLGVNSKELSDTLGDFLANERGGAYLKPGFTFGGPCLVKELNALEWLGRKARCEIPLIQSVLESNERHLVRVLKRVEEFQAKSILFSGVSFKEDTDDVRESQLLKIIDLLKNKPSYLNKVSLGVHDRIEVLAKVENLTLQSGVKVLKEINVEQEWDLIILGPFPMSEETIQKYLNKGSNVLDLGFFSLTNTIAGHEGYHSLFKSSGSESKQGEYCE